MKKRLRTLMNMKMYRKYNETVIHYLKNKVGVVDFANAQGLVMF